MIKLYLVGTHHLDFQGPERLKKFLGFVRPDTIGLESTIEEAQRRIKDHESVASQSLLLKLMLKSQYGSDSAENITKYLNMLGYETWVPYEFANIKKETKLVYCGEYDPNDFNGIIHECWGNKINEANEVTTNFIDEIAEIDFKDYQKMIDSSYDDNSICDELRQNSELFQKLFIDRDKKTESKIREALKSTAHTFVYVSGSLHILGDYQNLSEKFKELNPIVVKLKEVNQF